MIEFLTFRRFIAIEVLLIGYYLGAVLIPLVMWLARGVLRRRVPWVRRLSEPLGLMWRELTLRQKGGILLLLLGVFVAMEIVWRVCFEMLIGYFQMIEALKASVA